MGDLHLRQALWRASALIEIDGMADVDRLSQPDAGLAPAEDGAIGLRSERPPDGADWLRSPVAAVAAATQAETLRLRAEAAEERMKAQEMRARAAHLRATACELVCRPTTLRR